MTKRKQRSWKDEQRTRALIFAGGALLLAMVACVSVVGGGAFWFINSTSSRIADDSEFAPTRPTWADDSAELQVAVSPVMAPVLADLAAQFNAQEQRTPDGQAMAVQIAAMEPERMIAAALDAPPFQAVSPDSSLWLDRLEQQWAAQNVVDTANQLPVGQGRISQQVRYAVSPIVIAAWESAARDLGWPDAPVGWQTIQRQATADPNFKWNHPSTNTAAGLLATLAEFYAGAGLTRGLTEEAATAPATLEYVQAVDSRLSL